MDSLGYLCAGSVGALCLLFLAAALHDRREARARFARRIGGRCAHCVRRQCAAGCRWSRRASA